MRQRATAYTMQSRLRSGCPAHSLRPDRGALTRLTGELHVQAGQPGQECNVDAADCDTTPKDDTYSVTNVGTHIARPCPRRRGGPGRRTQPAHTAKKGVGGSLPRPPSQAAPTLRDSFSPLSSTSRSTTLRRTAMTSAALSWIAVGPGGHLGDWVSRLPCGALNIYWQHASTRNHHDHATPHYVDRRWEPLRRASTVTRLLSRRRGYGSLALERGTAKLYPFMKRDTFVRSPFAVSPIPGKVNGFADPSQSSGGLRLHVGAPRLLALQQVGQGLAARHLVSYTY